MKKIGFGFDSYSKETPKVVKGVYRALFWLSSVWVLAVEPRCPGMSQQTMHLVDGALTVGNVAIYQLCQLFGWQVPKASEPLIETDLNERTDRERAPASGAPTVAGTIPATVMPVVTEVKQVVNEIGTAAAVAEELLGKK